MSGLDFPGNNIANTDIRLIWDSSNLLPREDHTAIWRYYPRPQTDYYAVAWHSPNSGTDTFDNGVYSYGTHPFPAADNTVDGSGNSQTGNGGTGGSTHFWEIALDAKDFLTSATGPGGLSVTKNKWYVQIRRCRSIGGGSYEHTFIPDVTGNPDFMIVQNFSPTFSSSGANAAFYFGGSDWRSGHADPTKNDEMPSGILRGIQLYRKYLPLSEALVEAANDTINTPQTISGAAYIHYMNQNPTSADITDKSSAGHTPRWDNAFRPALYTSSAPNTTVTVGVVSGSFSIPGSFSVQGQAVVVAPVVSAATSVNIQRVDATYLGISSFNVRLNL